MEKDSENSLEHLNKFLNDELKEDYSYVILKKQMEEFGSQDILNEFGQVIGKLTLDFLRLNKILEIPDSRKNKLIKIESSKSFFSKFQLLKDNTNTLGKIKKRRFLSSNSKIYLKDKNGKKQYITKGDFKTRNYKIFNASNNKLLAKVTSFNDSDLVTRNLHINLENHYFIELFKTKDEKFMIISFVISVNNLISKIHWLSDVSGFMRRFIRLRPFGPGRSLN